MIDDNDLEGIVYKIEKALAGLKAVEDQVERTRSSLTGLKADLTSPESGSRKDLGGLPDATRSIRPGAAGMTPGQTWLPIGIGAWCLVAICVAIVIARVISARDEQVPIDDEDDEPERTNVND